MTVTVTYVGTATLLLRVGGLTILTDPAFDPAPAEYPGARPLRRTAGPALTPAELPPLDLVLLSHDQHADNLDVSGREVLAGAPLVLTTPEAADRLGGRAVGLTPWQSHTLPTPAGSGLTVTAVPARHGPEGTEHVTGPVTGFVLTHEDRTLYVSGDTTRHRALDELATRFAVDTAFLHLGDAHFPSTGDRSFSLSAREGAALARTLGARTVVPLHYEGWTHFTEPRAVIEAAFPPPGTGAPYLRFLRPGVAESV
ncbi:MBL fold metallo-hydrolase [Streptomyces sp. NPDC085529]|uniref:MBL fold metallo-hydrolase n=1 Tax=Streptomyces sp. NPDC085529 TaxID=3365729 RepID=UPI0037D8AB28